MPEREYLLDVSRLIWRIWSGRLPTGIDRVCLAYLDHFASRARAVVQKGSLHRILPPDTSDRLFGLLAQGGPGFRRSLMAMVSSLALSPGATSAHAGRIYLNIGHTGLDAATLPQWIARSGLKAVYLVHDLIPITHPEFSRAGESDKHERRMTNALRSATGIIGNSQATIEELRAFAIASGRPMPASVVAWLAGPDHPVNVEPAKLDRPYFVAVGTIEGRKNHILLLQIWQRLVARLGEATPQLIIIGQRGWEADHALAMLNRGFGLAGHVKELGRCPDVELAQLVAGARALLMPSFIEGFGLPIIEALDLGTPVIASDRPVFREIAGDIPTYLDPLDGPGWERAILEFIGESPERRRQKRLMAGYVAPDWAAHFAIVEGWLNTL
ncbi:MAG: glycosyltransferase family 1 protein [Novosphingobium sp.]